MIHGCIANKGFTKLLSLITRNETGFIRINQIKNLFQLGASASTFCTAPINRQIAFQNLNIQK